jgi:general secretion pathway protein G
MVYDTNFAGPPPARGRPRLGAVGFTLIEVLVVVAILGILAAIIVPRVMDRPDEARRTAAKADVQGIEQALKLYRLDNGFYPSTDQGLGALVQRPATNPVPGNWKKYLERLPKDPWGTDYQYLSPGVKGEIDVFSVGADRARGGEGSNADIGNWD